jgi:phospholipid/cholesterol/gamma-HCH transport system permease protein
VLHYDRPGDDTLVVQLAGSWKLEDGLPAMTELQRQLDVTPRVQRLVFDAHDMTAWDSGLLTFVREVVEQSTSRQMVVDQRGLPAGVQRLLALAAGNPRALRDASPEPKIRAFLRRGEAGATTA